MCVCLHFGKATNHIQYLCHLREVFVHLPKPVLSKNLKVFDLLSNTVLGRIRCVGALGRGKTCPVIAVWKGRILDKQARSCFSSTLSLFLWKSGFQAYLWLLQGDEWCRLGSIGCSLSPAPPPCSCDSSGRPIIKKCAGQRGQKDDVLCYTSDCPGNRPTSPISLQTTTNSWVYRDGENGGRHDRDFCRCLLLLLHLS